MNHASKDNLHLIRLYTLTCTFGNERYGNTRMFIVSKYSHNKIKTKVIVITKYISKF